MQNASVEMAHTAPYYFFGKDETFAIGCAIPFGLNSRQTTAWMMEGNGLKLMREFPCQITSSTSRRQHGRSNGRLVQKPPKSVADMKGLRMHWRLRRRADRTPGRRALSHSGGEIYAALEKAPLMPPNGLPL